MKIKKVSVVDQVSEALKENILNHQWEPGDKLPAEGELAEEFGVNRLSVRMALQKLNTLGLVETRGGDGTYVRKFSFAPYLEEISDIYRDEKHLNDVKELRNLLEGESMRIAAMSATGEEKDELRRLYDVYEKKREQYKADAENEALLDAVVDADFNFHYQIIRMSHNDLYKDIYFMTRKLIVEHIRELVSERIRRENVTGVRGERHDEIVEGICHADIPSLKRAREEILKILPIPGVDDDPTEHR